MNFITTPGSSWTTKVVYSCLIYFHNDRWLCLLYAGGDGGDDKHEGEGDHYSVLEVRHLDSIAVLAFVVILVDFDKFEKSKIVYCHLEQEGQESNDNEDCLLEKYAQKMVLNLPGK